MSSFTYGVYGLFLRHPGRGLRIIAFLLGLPECRVISFLSHYERLKFHLKLKGHFGKTSVVIWDSDHSRRRVHWSPIMKVFLPHLAFVLSAAASSVAGISTIDHDKVVGCYFGAWAFYRPGVGKFDIPDFDARYTLEIFYKQALKLRFGKKI